METRVADGRGGASDANLPESFSADRTNVVVYFIHSQRFNRSYVRIGWYVVFGKVIVDDSAEPVIINAVLQ